MIVQPSYASSILILIAGIILSGVAGYFSIIGLATIFSGSYISVIVMASALEASKIIVASWIYRNWGIAPVLLRVYMIFAVIVLVGITSMGIFGYLSAAHSQQSSISQLNTIQIEEIERQISSEKKRIVDNERLIEQLDLAVETLIRYERIRGDDGAIAIQQSQKDDREYLKNSIDKSSNIVDNLNSRLIELKQIEVQSNAKIGPLKYITEFIYKENASHHFDDAVVTIMIILVLVFDPLAITMIIAGNTGIMNRQVYMKKGENFLEVNANSIHKVNPEI